MLYDEEVRGGSPPSLPRPMPRSAFPIVLAVLGILAGRAVMSIDRVLDAQSAPVAVPSSPTAGTQAVFGRAHGLPGF